MVNPIKLFIGFKGRISRLWFWLGLFAIAAVSPFSIWTAMAKNPFFEVLPTVYKMGLPGLLWVIALLVPLAALMTKRLHDRGRSGFVAVLFYLPAAIALLKYFQFYRVELVQFEYWLGWVTWWVGAAGLWFLVDLGFFPSKNGTNRYGPEPGA